MYQDSSQRRTNCDAHHTVLPLLGTHSSGHHVGLSFSKIWLSILRVLKCHRRISQICILDTFVQKLWSMGGIKILFSIEVCSLRMVTHSMYTAI